MTHKEACIATKGFLEYVNKKNKEMRYRECSFTIMRTNIPLKPVIGYGEMVNAPGEQDGESNYSSPLMAPVSALSARRMEPGYVRSLSGLGFDVDDWPLCLSGLEDTLGANQTIENLQID